MPATLADAPERTENEYAHLIENRMIGKRNIRIG